MAGFLGDRYKYNGSPYATGPLSSLSSLSVTLVYCGQMVGWIKMPLVTEVGLRPGDVLLDGEPALPQKGAQYPHFSAHVVSVHVYCGETVAHLSYCAESLLHSPQRGWNLGE